MKNFKRLIFITILLSTTPCFSAEKVIFFDLLKKMLMNNQLIIEKRSIRKQEQIDSKTTSRFNAPVLSGNATLSSADLYQNSPFEFDTRQEVFTLGLGVNGVLPRYGVGYSLSFAQIEQNQNAFQTTPGFDSTGKNYSLGFEVDLLEDAGFLVGDLPFEEQKLEFELADSSYSQQAQDTILNFIKLYLNVTLAQEKIENTKVFQRQAERLFDNYKRLYDEGKLSKVELLSARIQVNGQKSTMYSLLVEYKQAKRDLFRYVGSFSTGEINKDWYFLPINSSLLTTEIDLQKLNSNNSNPDVLLIQKQINLSNLRVRSFENKVLPTLKFATGYQKIENPVIEPMTGANFGSDRYTVGLNLSIPLDNVGARADLEKARTMQYFLKLQEGLLLKNIDVVIEGISSEIEQLNNQIELTRENLKLAQERYKAALPLVRANSAARIDIFFYQNELTSIQYRLVELGAALLSRRADILYARGEFDLKGLSKQR